MKNSSVKKQMIKIYKCKSQCWLGYKITRSNPLTYHHIKKYCDGGGKTIDNGALLTLIAHEYLHIIEEKDIKIYLALNQMLQIINKQSHRPTLVQYKIIYELLEWFEMEHEHDLNSNKKILLKPKFYKRELKPKRK